MFHAQDDRPNQEVLDTVPRLCGHVFDAIAGPARSGIIEQDIEATKGFSGGIDRLGNIGLLGHIAVDIAQKVTETGLEHGALFILQIGANHLRAFSDKELDRAKANAGTTARNDRNLAV